MNRRRVLKMLALLPVFRLVKPKVAQATPLREFTDQPPLGFVPPSVSCWRPGRKPIKE